MHRKGDCLRSHVSPRDSEHLKAKKKPKKTTFTNEDDYCYYCALYYDVCVSVSTYLELYSTVCLN